MIAALVALLLLGACSEGNVFSLEPGTCFADPGSVTEVTDVTTVDCDEPHDQEVYALFDVPDGDFPGPDALEDAAVTGCLERFEDYVGRSFETSELGISWLVPTSDSWDQDDREVVCTLNDFSGAELTGSMQDSNR